VCFLFCGSPHKSSACGTAENLTLRTTNYFKRISNASSPLLFLDRGSAAKTLITQYRQLRRLYRPYSGPLHMRPVSEISPNLYLLSRELILSCFCKIFDERMRGRPRCRPAVSVPEISVSGLEILPYQHFRPVTRMSMIAGCILAFRMASL